MTFCRCCDLSSRHSFPEGTVSYSTLTVYPGVTGKCTEEIIIPLHFKPDIVGVLWRHEVYDRLTTSGR